MTYICIPLSYFRNPSNAPVQRYQKTSHCILNTTFLDNINTGLTVLLAINKTMLCSNTRSLHIKKKCHNPMTKLVFENENPIAIFKNPFPFVVQRYDGIVLPSSPVFALYLFIVILAVTIGLSRFTYVFTIMYILTNAFRISIIAVIAINTVLFSPRVPTGAVPRAASALKTQSYFEAQYPKTNYATMCPPQVS